MHVVVPFDVREPKTRLSALFDPDERQRFARVMLEDVCEAIEQTGHEPTILATAEFDSKWPVRVDDRSLSDAVNGVLANSDDPVAVVMADLALATSDVLKRVFDAEGDIVLVPGRGGGTNVVLARHPDFRVDYHGVSFRDHREQAETIDGEPTVIDSFHLSTDIDDPEDLIEVLLHGDGTATRWLREHGFAVVEEDGGVRIRRR